MKSPCSKKIRLVHVITTLTAGGAESMLYKLLKHHDGDSFDVSVVCLGEYGVFRDRIVDLGIPVHTLNVIHSKPSPFAFVPFLRLLRSLKPDIVQGWMYHANVAAMFAKPFLPRKTKILWNIRGTLTAAVYPSFHTRFAIGAGKHLSRFTDGMIYNSYVSAEQHEARGYYSGCKVMIPNGFNGNEFKPDPQARQALRRELGLSEDALVIGNISRFHLMKDHETLFQAAKIFVERRPSAHFVLAGHQLHSGNAELTSLIRKAGLSERVSLLGERGDVPRVINAFDVLTVSSSWGEAFPNVLGEAMACGVPCVTTDVGDAARIVGDLGIVVERKNPQAIADAWGRIAERIKTDAQLKTMLRDSILRRYSLPNIAEQYSKLYTELLQASVRSPVAVCT